MGFTANRELLNTATSYYEATVGKLNSAALPLICIHLACNSLQVQAPMSSIFNNLPIDKSRYVNNYDRVSKHLNLPEQTIVI